MSEARQRWSSRKLSVAIGCLLLATILLVFDHVDQGTWQFVFTITMGGYLAVQGGIDFMSLKNAKAAGG